jgi:uncharacterized membrane protein YphA (DoxX/SURF4 family)
VGFLTVVALALVLLGLLTEIYLISVGGLLLIVFMLLERTWHIRKLNKQIEEMKNTKNPVDTEDKQ